MTLGQRCDEIIRLIDEVLGGAATNERPGSRGGAHALLDEARAPGRVEAGRPVWS
jgi:hypothetical protein